jgi:hypothetical protein
LVKETRALLRFSEHVPKVSPQAHRGTPFATMPETIPERLTALAGLLSAVVLVLVALSTKTQGGAVHVAAPAPPRAAPTAELVTAEAATGTEARRLTPTRAAPARTALLVLTAARGDCWLSVRAGALDGRVLYEGILTRGRSIRVKDARLSVQFGAAANVDLSLNGKKLAALPTGTADVVVTSAGVRAGTGA